MEYRENPMFGRRVFFLNPPLSVENSILPVLKSKDYEVYIIRESSCAKPVLKKNENAICFIFIDDELALDGWYNFIKSFETDPSLKSIFLGVMSYKAKPKEQENFMMNLKLPGGFVMLEKNLEQATATIEGILKINGAKGVRKCIRLELNDNNDVNGYFTNGSMLYSFKLVDISALGCAAVVSAKMAGIFQKGRVIQNVSITMKRYSFVCSIVVYNTKITNDSCLVVMMFNSDTSMNVRKKIHDFIYETLDIRHRIVLENIARDMTDYTVRQRVEGEEENPEDLKDEVTEDKTSETEAAADNSENKTDEVVPDAAESSEKSENAEEKQQPSDEAAAEKTE